MQRLGFALDTISYSHARTNFSKILDRVCHGHEALVITRKQHPSVVLLSLAEYDLLVEKTKQVKSIPGPQKNDIQKAPDALAPMPPHDVPEPARNPNKLSFNDYN